MEIKKGLILCAGFGKRLMPLTKEVPKSLLQIENFALVEYSIKVLHDLGVNNIAINAHYLRNKVYDFFQKKYPSIKIFDEEVILDTGGAIINAKDYFDNEYFFVLNSDTIWQQSYIPCIKDLYNNIVEKNLSAGLLLAMKEQSFDQNLSLDFDIIDNYLVNEKKLIYTGLQILHSGLLNNQSVRPFSIREIWDNLITLKKITGNVYKGKFYHATNLEVYENLKKEKIIY